MDDRRQVLDAAERIALGLAVGYAITRWQKIHQARKKILRDMDAPRREKALRSWRIGTTLLVTAALMLVLGCFNVFNFTGLEVVTMSCCALVGLWARSVGNATIDRDGREIWKRQQQIIQRAHSFALVWRWWAGTISLAVSGDAGARQQLDAATGQQEAWQAFAQVGNDPRYGMSADGVAAALEDIARDPDSHERQTQVLKPGDPYYLPGIIPVRHLLNQLARGVLAGNPQCMPV